MSRSEYMTLREPVSADVEVSRSLFRCDLVRVSTGDEARAQWGSVRAQYRDARHHCLAFVIGADGQDVGSSDDGEPSGTAGAPMLEVLRGSDYRDVVAVVTRWFGGTLLGTGGLIRAYSDAVRAALEVATPVRRRRFEAYRVSLGFVEASEVLHQVRRRGYDIVDEAWTDQVTVDVLADPSKADALDGLIASLTAGRVAPLAMPPRWLDD